MRRGRWVLALVALVAAGLWWWHLATPTTATPSQVSPAGKPPAAADAGIEHGPPLSAAAQPPAVVSASGVPIHLIRHPRLTVPDPPYGPAYARLSALAHAGDTAAQYQLGLLLYQCRDVPADPAALEQDIEKTYETRRRGGWDVEDPQNEDRVLRGRFGDCEGVPAAERNHYRDWLRSAADSGLLEAQLDLPLHLPVAEYCQFMSECTPEQRQRQEALDREAVDYLGRARDGGSAMALWTFGAWYAEGDVLPQDDVQAYAYFSALDQIFAASGDSRRFDTMLADLRTRLRPADLEQADAQTRSLLSNPNCCVMTAD